MEATIKGQKKLLEDLQLVMRALERTLDPTVGRSLFRSISYFHLDIQYSLAMMQVLALTREKTEDAGAIAAIDTRFREFEQRSTASNATLRSLGERWKAFLEAKPVAAATLAKQIGDQRPAVDCWLKEAGGNNA